LSTCTLYIYIIQRKGIRRAFGDDSNNNIDRMFIQTSNEPWKKKLKKRYNIDTICGAGQNRKYLKTSVLSNGDITVIGKGF